MMYLKKSVLFKDIFNSTNEKLHQQMQRYKGLDHPFEVGERQLLIDNNEFELKVETDMPHMVIYTFNEPQNWDSDFNIYKSHSGFTVETQNLPNDINMYGEKAQSILEAHTPYLSKTSYQINEK